jgi:hypothetical protein
MKTLWPQLLESIHSKNRLPMNVLILLGAACQGVLLFFATPFGLGMSPDSVGYLKAADGLLNGNGFSYMSPQWPPLYPILIAATSYLFHMAVQEGARILAGGIVALTTLIIVLPSEYRGQSYIKIAIALLIFMHPIFAQINFYAWSEALFILLIVCDLRLLSNLLDSKVKAIGKQQTVPVWQLAALSSLGVMTRYAGITIFITNMIFIFWFERKQRVATRLRSPFIQVFIIVGVLSLWFGYSILHSQTMTNRTFAFHPPSLDQISNGLTLIGKWFLPTLTVISNVIYLSIGVLVLVSVFFALKKKIYLEQDSKKSEELIPASLFIIVYVLFIIFSMTFIDAATPFDNRILSPVLIAFLLLLISFSTGGHGNTKLYYVGIFLFFSSVLFSLAEFKSWILLHRFGGVELSEKKLKEKEIFKFIIRCDQSLRIVSDKPWEIDLHIKGKVDWFPRKVDMTSNKKNTNYDEDIMRLSDKYPLIVAMDSHTEIIHAIDALASYVVIYRADDGIVWQSIVEQNQRPCRPLSSVE